MANRIQFGSGLITDAIKACGNGSFGNIVADGAYDSDKIRKRSKQLGAKACIKPHPNPKVKKRYDKTIYRNRNQIERFFGRIKRCPRVATRYEKKPQITQDLFGAQH